MPERLELERMDFVRQRDLNGLRFRLVCQIGPRDGDRTADFGRLAFDQFLRSGLAGFRQL